MSTKAFKQEKIEAFKNSFEKAKVAILSDYRGFTVEEIQKLRRELQKNGGDYTVVKNTLAKVAVKGTNFEALEEVLKGPSAVAFGFEDEVSSAKILSKFIKETEKGEILGAVLEGKLLSKDEAEKLATMPLREELYAKMLGCINSPASGIANSMNAVITQLVRAISEVTKQKA